MAKCRKTSFLDLKCKDVINICDGKMLGRVIDAVIDVSCGRITGIVVPGDRGWGLFRRAEDLFIPWRNILRIGEDVILIELFIKEQSCNVKPRRGFSAEPAYLSSDTSQAVDDEAEDELKPKVLKYITASSVQEDD